MILSRVFLSALVAVSLLSADTLLLRNGSTINGRFVSGDNRAIRFAVGSQVNTYDLTDVDTLRFADYQAPQASLQRATRADGTNPPNAPWRLCAEYDSCGLANSSRDAGFRPHDRWGDSDRDYVGKTYRATVDKDCEVNGQTAIPRDADAIVVLANAQDSGKIEGKTILSLNLKSIMVNGRTFDVASSAVDKESASRGKRSGEVIGGTAALGAIIGAIAGGGKGAAIGAGSGAAVGTGVQVATSGQKVKVPSETKLIFTLQNPVDL